jgi:2-(1,2-epoxy-1,2-dihydrophenyl)acetyl-CoA isomerase
MSDSTDAVLPLATQLRDGVFTITLNRPKQLNSVNRAMRMHLRQAIERAAAPDARVIVLTGAGRGFCAGQDLTDLEPDSLAQSAGANVLTRDYNPLVLALRALPKPTIAAVNGIAAGAGCNLALGCDFVVAKESADFLQAFVHIGLLPDCGGTYYLPRLMGTAQAAAFMMLGEKLPATEAERLGLIYKAVSDEQFDAQVSALAGRLAALPPLALAEMKLALYAGAPSLAEQLALEAAAQARLAASRDYQEGVAAFLEKRKAVFSGV